MKRRTTAVLASIFFTLTVGALVGCHSLKRKLAVDLGADTPEVLDSLPESPRVCSDPSIHMLAADLDCLERHIDRFGSVTAKAPDVWGQARLTQHREEFEKEMAKDLSTFQYVLSASEARSDQSFLATATTLSLAAQPKRSASAGSTSSPSLVPTNQTVEQTTTDPSTGSITKSTTTSERPPPAKAPDPIKPLDTPDVNSLVSGTNSAITQTPAKLFTPGFGNGTIGLEPTEVLAQKKRYLDFLNQLRRENEGDDTADAPGYSLNLMRVPVSVLPGKHTDVGFGAEITMTLTPILNDNLLPTTYRNLVTNGVVKQLALPLTQLLGDEKNKPLLSSDAHDVREDVISLYLFTPIKELARNFENDKDHTLFDRRLIAYYESLVPQDQRRIDTLAKGFDETTRKIFERLASGELKRHVGWGLYTTDVITAIATINACVEEDNDVIAKGGKLTAYVRTLSDTTKAKLEKLATTLPTEQRQFLERVLGGRQNTFIADVYGVCSDLDRPVTEVVQAQIAISKSQKAKPVEDSAVTAAQQNIIRMLPEQSKAHTIARALLMNDQQAQGIASKETNVEKQDRDAIREAATKVLMPRIGSFDNLGPGTLSKIDLKTPIEQLRNLEIRFLRLNFSFSPGLDHKTAFPVSQLVDVYSLPGAITIAQGAYAALKEQISKQHYAHLPDIQGYLRHEVDASYQFLMQDDCAYLWEEFCPRIVPAVRTRTLDVLQDVQREFRAEVRKLTHSEDQDRRLRPYNPQGEYSVTASLAWCILVEAALLNERLQRDIEEIALAKDSGLAMDAVNFPYYLPNPGPEVCRAFNDYVRLRWPIHVFALDPYIQEQNVADSLSTRREMQLALAVAFTNGQINAKNLTKYVRRLEAEYETVALNRTQVGFSHGESTFGWRFYPRYQTPDTPSNFEDIFRNQLIGGPNRNQLLKQRRLEPGTRECVAIVLTPSFVPYVHLDTTSNWFPLTNPKQKVCDTTQAMRLSRTVQAIQSNACGVRDAHMYRDGEDRRLMVRLEQLAARLPTQTVTAPMPTLNTLGGFELFNNGTSDLAPDLYGWYGAPGLDPDYESTTLFLVGDHFSPLRTHVIVGNQVIAPTNQTLLSRQVMKVTILKGAYSVGLSDGSSEVRVHVATPYGVTRDLAIPVASRKPITPAPKPGFNVAGAKLTIQYALKQRGASDKPGDVARVNDPATVASTGTAKDQFVAVKVEQESVKFQYTFIDPTTVTAAKYQVQLVFTIPGANGQPPCTIVVPCSAGLPATSTPATPVDATTPANGGSISIKNEDLRRIAAALLQQKCVQDLAAAGKLTDGLTTTKVLITAVGSGTDSQSRQVAANDQLTIQFKFVGYDPACEITLERCPDEKPKAPAPILQSPS